LSCGKKRCQWLRQSGSPATHHVSGFLEGVDILVRRKGWLTEEANCDEGTAREASPHAPKDKSGVNTPTCPGRQQKYPKCPLYKFQLVSAQIGRDEIWVWQLFAVRLVSHIPIFRLGFRVDINRETYHQGNRNARPHLFGSYIGWDNIRCRWNRRLWCRLDTLRRRLPSHHRTRREGQAAVRFFLQVGLGYSRERRKERKLQNFS
jgi:hypothetical protein